MKCDSCDKSSKVFCLSTRQGKHGVRRRYECWTCKKQWSTVETKATRDSKAPGAPLISTVHQHEQLLKTIVESLHTSQALIEEIKP